MHELVYKEANQSFDFLVPPTSNVSSNHNIFLAAVAHQQHLECRQQQHEHRHAFTPAEFTQLIAHVSIQHEPLVSAAMTLNCRTYSVCRQLQHLRRAGQLRAPILHLLVEYFAL